MGYMLYKYKILSLVEIEWNLSKTFLQNFCKAIDIKEKFCNIKTKGWAFRIKNYNILTTKKDLEIFA